MALERDQVVEAAVGILDAWGLADLSMRRLAEALGVKAGALYWHVANKQTLLALVADRILAEVGAPETTGGPAEQLERWATRLRQVLLAHRDAAELVASALASGLCDEDPVRLPQQALLRHGAEPQDARRGGRALLHLVLGHVVEEQNAATLHRLGLRPGLTEGDDEDFAFAVAALVDGLTRTVKE
ncbi:TetR family transcriptional regulator [Luteococcus peritonei]|uniref:TetR family transcriptional regulator n=1 Tax=Luteococcus peritonei TaxID=88874 RepID=A0ABW4RXS6_9ACTN